MDKLSSMNAFVKVVEANSFSRAATQLGIGYSAITRAISGLERQLGVQLLERSTRRIALTSVGEMYLDCCRHVLGTIESTEYDLSAERIELNGVIHIGLPNLHGNRIFGPLLMNFAKAHQGIRLEVLNFDQLTDEVRFKVDITLLVSEERSKPLDTLSLGQMHMQMVAAPEYLTQFGYPMNLDELSAHRCLNSAANSSKPIWRFIERGAFKDVRVSPFLNTRNGDGLLDAALSGLGLACLPTKLINTYLQERKLMAVLAEFPVAPLEVSQLVSSDKLVTNRTKVLAKYISEHFKPNPVPAHVYKSLANLCA